MPAITPRTVVVDSPSSAYDTPVSSSPSKPSRSYSSPSALYGGAGARPLCPAKLVLASTPGGPGPSSAASSRRFNVSFSPQLAHTKLFRSEEPLSALSSSRCPSSDSSAPEDNDSSPSSRRHNSPSVRGILKPTPSRILVARSAKEGTWNNREPARLVVAGQKPAPFYSTMVLAELCDGADDGVAIKPPSDDEPDSDDSVPQEDYGIPNQIPSDASEEEEGMECLHSSSLVGVILEGADDLLTLEEAYISLVNRLRDVVYEMGPATASATARFDTVWQPIAEEAPAVVRAIQRDLHRLMGRVPSSEVDIVSSPFRSLTPARGLPPSPSKSPREGYTAAEVLYRREASGVGAAVLRFLAITFSQPRLFSSFSEADVQSLLDQILVIMRAPALPTPFAKRTYSLTLMVLSALNLPPSWVRPFAAKLATAVEAGLTTIGTGPAPIKDASSIRRESYSAAGNLLKRYPDMMFPAYPALLPLCLRAYSSSSKMHRRCGVAVAAMFVNAKLQLLEGAGAIAADKFEWNKLRSSISKSEQFVSNWLKMPVRVNGKYEFDRNTNEKKTESFAICSTFKATIGEARDVAWACTAWATLTSLLGHTYNMSPAGRELDAILDRCLQKSANAVRPTLASASWMHAVYAYLQAGSNLSVTETGHVVRSYSPFVSSSYQDTNGRIQTIMFPLRHSLDEALKPANVARALVTRPEFNNEQRWTWQRGEKPRRYDWMVTTGMSVESIVYAYTVVALAHEEPSAAEVSRMSGIPSSDGVVPDITPEERRLPRLDQTFELVLHPTLTKMFAICGVDELKRVSWEVFAAVTAGTTGPVPSLDRLLSKRYLNAEIVGLEDVTAQVLLCFARDRIKAEEIPAWGKLWVAKRLGKLLALFNDAFDGIRGINELASVDWVTTDDGVVLLPTLLEQVWENFLYALAFANTPESPTPLYVLGLQAVTRTILTVYKKDPASYIPICLVNAEGKSALDPNAIRLGISGRLFSIAVRVLGEGALGGMRIDPKVPGLAEPTFAVDPIGHPTAPGYILGHLLSCKHLASTVDLGKSISQFSAFISALLDSGCSRDIGTTLLGDLTNKIPFIFDGHEQLQLCVWRLLARKWTEVVDLEPAEEASATNHTGGLLTTLLSCPFRNTSTPSVWYTSASADDLNTWDALLEATVLRFRAKRAGSNLGVMETLAAHLGDFIRLDDDEFGPDTRHRRSCDTIIHCLAKACIWVALVEKEHYHADHYRINENYVPSDFLALVATSMVDAYASEPVSSNFPVLVEAITDLLKGLPEHAVEEVVASLRPGLAIWMTDANKRVSGDLAVEIDAMYVALIETLTRAIQSDAIPASSETMDTYIELYAPRLSNAQSSSVPTAFQQLWHRAFQPLGAVEYTDDVAGFLRDVITAVPGFIIAEGLSSLESSDSLFPYAQTVPPLPQPAGQPADQQPDDDDADEDATEMAIGMAQDTEADEAEVFVPPTTTPEAPVSAPDDTNDYDADDSQTPSKRAKHKRTALIPQSSSPAPADEDVFGPKSTTRSRKIRRRGNRSETRSSASSPAPADTTVIAETPLREHDAPTRREEVSPTGTTSLFSSASRWFQRRVPSLLSFGSSSDSVKSEDSDTPPASTRSRRKRRRGTDSPALSEMGDVARDTPPPEAEVIVIDHTPPSSRAGSPAPVPATVPSTKSRSSRRSQLRQTSSLEHVRAKSSVVNTPSSVEPAITRSAARKRDLEEASQSSDRSERIERRKRRRAARSATDESPLPVDEAAELKRKQEDNEAREKQVKEAKERKEQAKAEARERKEKERREKEERLEKERLEMERLEMERLEMERLEAERLEQERLEQERLEQERLEQERLEQERLERERVEKERLERLEMERLERERLEKERLEEERLERERLELERLQQERLEQERLERERLEKERLEKERLEQERLEKERLEKERLEQERLEKERLENERLKNERLEKQRRKQERLDRERRLDEALERKERIMKEHQELREQRRLEAERCEQERLEAERKEHEGRERVKAECKAQKAAAAEEAARLAPSKKGKGKQKAPEPEPEVPSETPEISGRFDDAPGDITPRPTRRSPRTNRLRTPSPQSPGSDPSTPDTPTRRTSEQARLLDMFHTLATSERSMEALRTMNMEDAITMLRHINFMQSEASEGIRSQAAADREARRERRRAVQKK